MRSPTSSLSPPTPTRSAGRRSETGSVTRPANWPEASKRPAAEARYRSSDSEFGGGGGLSLRGGGGDLARRGGGRVCGPEFPKAVPGSAYGHRCPLATLTRGGD